MKNVKNMIEELEIDTCICDISSLDDKTRTKAEKRDDLKEYLTKKYKSKVHVKYIDLCINVYFAILDLYERKTVSGKLNIRDCDMTLHIMNFTKKSFEECFEIGVMVSHYDDFVNDYEKDIVRKTVKSLII